jgi:hypothetical protein
LADYGFRYHGDHGGVTLYWVRGDLFFRVGYLPETIPDYELLIGLGISEDSPLTPKNSENSIGVWRLLPAGIAPELANWRFASPPALRDELVRAWADAIVPYVAPAWPSPITLRAASRSTRIRWTKTMND